MDRVFIDHFVAFLCVKAVEMRRDFLVESKDRWT